MFIKSARLRLTIDFLSKIVVNEPASSKLVVRVLLRDQLRCSLDESLLYIRSLDLIVKLHLRLDLNFTLRDSSQSFTCPTNNLVKLL